VKSIVGIRLCSLSQWFSIAQGIGAPESGLRTAAKKSRDDAVE